MGPDADGWWSIYLHKFIWSSVILHLFDVLMQFDHLVVQFLYSDLLIETYPIIDYWFFFFCCFFGVRFILKIDIAVFDKLFSELSHAFCSIFWFRRISQNTSPSFGFWNLLLWDDLGLRKNLWRVNVTGSCFIGKNAALGEKVVHFYFWRSA